jgi:hypothetical protein
MKTLLFITALLLTTGVQADYRPDNLYPTKPFSLTGGRDIAEIARDSRLEAEARDRREDRRHTYCESYKGVNGVVVTDCFR